MGKQSMSQDDMKACIDLQEAQVEAGLGYGNKEFAETVLKNIEEGTLGKSTLDFGTEGSGRNTKLCAYGTEEQFSRQLHWFSDYYPIVKLGEEVSEKTGYGKIFDISSRFTGGD